MDAHGDPLPPGAIARLGTVRLRQLNPAFSIAFSPDGNSFATGQGDGHICIWDRSTGRPLRRLAGHTRTVHSLLYVEGGRTLLSGGADATIRWWDPGAGAEKRKVQATGAVTALVLGMDGEHVLAASGRSLQMYKIAGGARLDEIRLAPAARPGVVPAIGNIGASLAVIPRDDRVILGGQDGNLHLLHLPSRKETSAIPIGVKKGPIALAVSPDGRTLAWGDAAGKIRTMDLGTGSELKGLVGHTDTVLDLAFSPDGRRLASRSADGTVRLWDLAGKELWQSDSCGNLPNSLAFSPEGNCLAVARVDKAVDLLDTATGKRLFDFPGHTEQVYGLAVSPDGTRLASSAVSSGGKVRDAIHVWDLAARTLIWRGPPQAGPGARCVAWRPDGNALASCGGEKKVRLWDAAGGRELATLPDQPALVTCLIFHPRAGTVLFGHQRGLGAWDPPAGKAEDRPEAGAAYVYSLAVSRDGRRFAVGGSSTVQLLDANQAAPARTLTDARGVYWALRFTPDGTQLVGAGASGVSLWDLDTGGLAASVRTSNRSNWCADLSPDGRLLAVAGGDGNLLLMETATCETLAVLSGHQGAANAVAFLDGRRLASAGADTQVLIWSLDEVFGPPPAAPAEAGLLAAWEALSGEAPAAFRAQRALAAAGEKALALMRQRLRPPPPPDANRIRQLIVQLDSDRFAVREAATAGLRKIGRDALPFLQKALAETASAEVRQRAALLVEALTAPQPLTPQTKQALRAIAVLEAVGGEEARAILRSLADSHAPALIVRHARAALARLRPAP